MFTIYTTPGCFVCKKTIAQLQAASVPCAVIDVSQDPEALTYVKEVLGAEAAPVVVDNEHPEEWWCGPNPMGVAAIIKAHQDA